MIDLRKQGLPDTVEVDGKSFKIKTGFKEWLEFGERIKDKNCTLGDLMFLFEDKIPQQDFSVELFEFYTNENSTPNYDDDNSKEIVLDYIEDGEYIYSSFMTQYGIDLIENNIHWWKFKALFLGLKDDSKIKDIMAMRKWEKTKKTPEQVAKENKRAWSLNNKREENKGLIEEINKLFYGC